MDEEDVLEVDGQPEDEQQPQEPVEEQPAKKVAAAADDGLLKEMRRTLKEQRSALREANEAAKFWMTKAQGGGKEEKPGRGSRTAALG